MEQFLFVDLYALKLVWRTVGKYWQFIVVQVIKFYWSLPWTGSHLHITFLRNVFKYYLSVYV